MDFLREDYLQQLISQSQAHLYQHYQFAKDNYTSVESINAAFIDRFFSLDRSNLLVTVPYKKDVETLFYPAVTFAVLHCFLENLQLARCPSPGQIIFDVNTWKLSKVKEVDETQVMVVPALELKKQPLCQLQGAVAVSDKVISRLSKIVSQSTMKARNGRLHTLCSELQERVKEYSGFFETWFRQKLPLPLHHPKKVILVASKKECIDTLPSSLPFQYFSKSGAASRDTLLDPLLYVVNDFQIAKELIENRNIDVATLILLGDSKYKNIAPISKLYRQQKVERCIFLGTEDVTGEDNFPVLKWNWTPAEFKYFAGQNRNNIKPVLVKDEKLSQCISHFAQTIEEIENAYDQAVNLKRLLKYIRKVYALVSLREERRRERLNTLFSEFQEEASSILEEEFYAIGVDSTVAYDALEKSYSRVIQHVKCVSPKSDSFNGYPKSIDCIVVPHYVKEDWKEDIEWVKQYKPTATAKSLANLTELMQSIGNEQQLFKCFDHTQIITLREFEMGDFSEKLVFFLSLYGYGVYPEMLLDRIYSKDMTSQILLFNEEGKALKYYQNRFNETALKEFRSADRELLCGLSFPAESNAPPESIDAWIQYLVESETLKFSRAEEIRYQISFIEDTKKVKERESKQVYIERKEENYIEVRQLKKGDRVRIYQNPDKELLHDIVKVCDGGELFEKVDKYSELWRKHILLYRFKKGISDLELYEDFKANGLRVEANTFKHWLRIDCKTKFPRKKIDLIAIMKTVNETELTKNIQQIFALMKEYSGSLNRAGLQFSEEINQYILTREKGPMLEWISDADIEKIIKEGAPLRTIKEIEKLDYQLTD